MIRYASRKFLISLLALASADILCLLHTIDASVWGATVGSVVALYVAGNVSQKAVTRDEITTKEQS